MPEELKSPSPRSAREDGKSSPKSKKKESSFQRELKSTLRDRKKRGLSAGFSDLDVTEDTEDSDDGIGSDEDDLLGQFNMTLRPKRTDRPSSAKPRGGPLMQTMKQPWKPPSAKEEDELSFSSPKESPRPSPRVSPKVSPKLPRKDELRQESPAPSPRTRRLTEKEKTSPSLTPRRFSRSPSPDDKKGRSTDILDLLGDDFGGVRTSKSSSTPKPQPRQRRGGPDSPGRSDASSPGRRDSSPGYDKKPTSGSLFGTKRSPELQRKSSRDSSPMGRKSPLFSSTKKTEKSKSFRDADSDDSDDGYYKNKRGVDKYQPSGRRSPQSPTGRKSPQTTAGKKKSFLDASSEDENRKFKTRRPQSPTGKKTFFRSDSDSDDEGIRRKDKTREKKKSLLDELQTDGPSKKDKKKKESSLFETSDDEVSGITAKGRRSPIQRDRRSPSPQNKRQSPTLFDLKRTPSPKLKKDEEKVDDLWASTPKRPPSGRKPKTTDDSDEEDLGHSGRMRYISTDSDVTREFRNARERPSTGERSRARTRVIRPKVVTRPSSASGRLNQSLSARSDGSTMTMTARSTTPNFDDSSSIRQAIYEDWYVQKMERAKKELQVKKKKEKEEEEKKEKEKKDKELEAVLSYRAWQEQKNEYLKKKAKQEAKKKEKQKKEEEEKEIKKYEAKKLFKSWKESKDEELTEKHREKVKQEQRKLKEEERKKKLKQKDSKSAFVKWNETKEDRIKQKLRETRRQEQEKKKRVEEEKKEKEMMSTKAYDEFLLKKEQQEKEEKRRKRTMTPVSTVPFRPSGRTVPFGK
ncbi:uncharacterized protein LOC144446659 [Glandiceps talaboti]